VSLGKGCTIGILTVSKPFLVKAIKAFDKGTLSALDAAAATVLWSSCATVKVEMSNAWSVFVANFFKHLEKSFSLPFAIEKK
jgi:hypothetical protein